MKIKIVLIIFFFSSICHAQNVVLNDNFENDNFNLAMDVADFKVYFEKGGMVLDNTNENMSKWRLIKTSPNFNNVDFDVEASISVKQAAAETSAYGLVWACYNNYTNYHSVNLNSKKQHQLSWYHNNSFTYDLNWTDNRDLKTGKENVIKVSKRAQNVAVYVNGNLIGKTNNIAYYGSLFGFIVGPKMKIKVTNLKVTEFPLSIDVVDTFDPSLKAVKLPETISSSTSTETTPIISADGTIIYFARRYCNLNIGNSNLSDAWFSTLENGKWSPAQNMGRPINNESSNFVVSASPDNNSLLLANAYSEDGQSTIGSGVSIVYKNDQGWGTPKTMKIKNFVNKSDYVGYFLATDNKHLLMAIEKEKGYGAKDLYVSFPEKDGTWSTPLNLGNVLNTSSEETNPFLASDGKTLYFSSDGHPSYGGFDLFVSKRLDDSWTNWSKPKNLGNVINSSSNDFSFFLTAKGDKAFIGRDSDLYEIKNTVKQDPVILVKGKVYDSKSNQLISAAVIYNVLGNEKELGRAMSDSKTGSYSIVLPYGQKYSFMAEKEGYYSVTQNVDVSRLTAYKELTVDLYLKPIEKGQTIRLNNIFFESGKYDLLPESNAELDKLHSILLENKQLKIEISGHTDDVGADTDNLLLSTNRANAVVNYLLNKGITKERLLAKGYGETKFIATNDTEEGKQENRRVEFSILAM